MYNDDMKKIEEKIIFSFESIKDDIYGKFGDLWELDNSFERHIKRRQILGHIDNKDDYIDKTLDCLSNSNTFIFAQHKGSWDNVCYNKSKDWAVVFNENGKMMTSYKIDTDSYLGFESRHTINNAIIKKGKTNEKFREYFKNIRS